MPSDTIFREYDIRGVVGKDFDTAFARDLGRAFASLVHEELGTRPGEDRDLKIAVGRDCRLSGQDLCTELIEGLLEGGVNVLDCGMGPSPQLYFSVFFKKLDGGIQITGSHNPVDHNGFKMMIGEKALSGEYIQRLKKKVREYADSGFVPLSGMSMAVFGAREVYTEELIARFRDRMGERKVRLVVDAGNGVGGMVAPVVLRGLGCEVIELYTEPDGRFPNHHPDPNDPRNLAQLSEQVLTQKADLGIAFDGDADRIGVVDQNAEVVYGDMLLIIFARELLKEVKHPTIIADVKCSERVFSLLESEGARVIMARTGHSLIKEQMKEIHAELGGELSGHLFFGHEYYGIDDAIYAAAYLAEILSHSIGCLSDLLADVPQMACTPELHIRCPEEHKFLVVEQAKKAFSEYQVNTLDGVRITFPKGWGLVRASNTQPVLVLRFEAESDKLLQEYQELVEARIAEIREQFA